MRHRRSIRVRLANRPGSLHRLTGITTDHNVNLVRLEVLSWDEADVWDDIELVAPASSPRPRCASPTGPGWSCAP